MSFVNFKLNPNRKIRKAVFLDRDGTIIVDLPYLNDPSKIEFLPGVFTALKELRDQSYDFFVVTNQAGLAKKIVEYKNMQAIHNEIRKKFAQNGIYFSGFYYSPYNSDSLHLRRKPNPGMLLQAAHEWNIDLKQSWMIGDRMGDVEAGHKAGCQSILLPGDSQYRFDTLSNKKAPDAYVPNLIEAAKFIKASAFKNR